MEPIPEAMAKQDSFLLLNSGIAVSDAILANDLHCRSRGLIIGGGSTEGHGLKNGRVSTDEEETQSVAPNALEPGFDQQIGYAKTEDRIHMIPKTPSFKYLLRSFDSAVAHAIQK